MTEDLIVELIDESIGDCGQDDSSMTVANGLLVVRQCAKRHRQITILLNKLRQFK